MILDDVVLLAARTSRSQAYVQALVAADLLPARVVLLGDTTPLPPATGHGCTWQDLLLPDLSESIDATCARAGITLVHCRSTDVGSDEVALALQSVPARLVVFSGPPGQIVPDAVLRRSGRFLHLHSGWLPQYRGSTTLYYALLDGEDPAVTALYLDASIDTGPVIARRTYPKPPAGMDVDRVYDAAIRADLLVRVLRQHADDGAAEASLQQDPHEGTTYYVIHPVLKHLALLSLASEPSA